MSKTPKKRITFVVFSIILVFTLLCGQSVYATVEVEDESFLYEKAIQLQEKAVAAYQLLDQAFDHDSLGYTLFPDDYAGSFIEGDKLVLLLTDTSAMTTNKYRAWAKEYADYLVFKDALYSYNEMQKCSDSIAQVVANNGYTVTQYYVSETSNEIVICVQKTAATDDLLERKLYTEFSVPVRIEEAESTTTTTTNLRGGNKIVNSISSTQWIEMTLSCCGTYGGYKAILTCGHGGQSAGDTIKYYSNTGSTIGTVNYHRYYNNGTGDFEIIKVTNTSIFDTTNKITSSYSVTGTLSDPPVNTVLKYYSRTTSSFGYGGVNNRNITVNADGTHTIKGLTRIKVISGSCQPGDSGGPFFQETSSGVNYCGVIHGKNTIGGYLYVFFTPYTHITPAGFSAKTS